MTRAFALALFVVIQLLALELSLAAFFWLKQDYDAEMWKYTRDLKRNVSDARGHVHVLNGSAKLMGVEVRTNSLGLRDEEARLVARSHGRLIQNALVVGDSFTLGWGVEQAHTFASLLKGCGDSNYELSTVNGGVGNYNLQQTVAQARDLIPKLQPKSLLYAFYWNDAEPYQKEPDSWFARHSHLALFWRKIQVRLLHSANKPQSYLDYYASTFEGIGWKRFEESARELASLAKDNKATLHVALLPELRTPDEPRIKAIYGKVEGLFQSLGVKTANLLGRLPPQPSPQAYWVAKDDPHPNALAHREIASLLQKSFWPNCSGP